MIHPARDELLAFAAAVRGEDWAGELSLALAAAASAGWEWPRTGLAACRLVFTDGALPRELTEAVRSPLRPMPAAGGPAPASVAADLAAVRERAAALSARRRAGEGGAG